MYPDRLSSLNKTILPYPSTPISFRTFPDSRLPSGTNFRFVVSSCVTPNFPYVPLQSRRIKGFDLLAQYLWPTLETSDTPTAVDNPLHSEASEPVQISSNVTAPPIVAPVLPVGDSTPPPVEFLMFLGDFVYADVPLYFGDNKEAYRRLYRRNYMSESFRKVYKRLREWCF